MDDTSKLGIPFGTWPWKKRYLLLRSGRLRPSELQVEESNEEALVRHLRAILSMARRAVIDLFRSL